jgi:hypothetical protein
MKQDYFKYVYFMCYAKEINNFVWICIVIIGTNEVMVVFVVYGGYR